MAILNNMILFVLFFPLFTGVFIMLFGAKVGLIKTISIYFSLYIISVFCLVCQLMHFLRTNIIVQIKLFDVIVFENFSINFSFLFDMLTIIMMFVVVFISFLVSNFSIWYMKGDPNHLKFLNYLNFFSFFMLLLVCSNSLIIIFIGWEGIGIFSYLLINFWSTRLNANRSALKAILVNKIGDCFIYLFMFIYFFEFDSFGINDCKALIFSYSFDDLPLSDFKLQSFLTVLLIIAAMAKSAQIFFHIWLPDAMEGPTPVSALLHAATMVTAGAYILIKFNWIILDNEKLLFFVSVVGLITNFIASLIAIFQHDIKKIIAYSTASQIGLIFIAIGVAKSNLALFHIFNHAFFKALLFILAGILIHSLNNNQDLRSIFKIKNNLFFVYSSLLIASFTLAGMPFLSSYFSKEFILQCSFLNSSLVKDFILYALNFSVVTTTLYTLKILSFVFFPDNVDSMTYQTNKINLKKIKFFFSNKNNIIFLFKKIPQNMNFITLILAFYSIFNGFLFCVIFNSDYFFFNNNFFNSLSVEKAINIINFEYSCLVIFFSILFSVYTYPKVFKYYVNHIYFYSKYNFFKTFFETKMFFESFFFYLVKYFYFNRDLTRSIDKEVIENVFVAYWNYNMDRIDPYVRALSSNLSFFVFFMFLNFCDVILFATFPEALTLVIFFLLHTLFWDFVDFFLTRRLDISWIGW